MESSLKSPHLTCRWWQLPRPHPPALFNGEYYVWVNLYMEGGSEWAPVNGVDYAGSTAAPISFDGSAVSLKISLSPWLLATKTSRLILFFQQKTGKGTSTTG